MAVEQHPITLPSEYVEEAKRERERGYLRQIGDSLDKQLGQASESLASVADVISQSPFLRAFRNEPDPDPTLGIPDLDALTPAWVRDGLEQEKLAASPQPQAAPRAGAKSSPQPLSQPVAMPQASAAPGGAPASAPEPLGEIAEGDPDKFFATAGPYARAIERETGIPAALSLAIAANETGYGQRRYMAGANNYHGIQDTTGTGTPYVDWRPGPNGEKIYYEARQSGFANPLEGFRGFARFLLDNPRYQPALARYRQSGDVNQLAADIHAAGYAEDPQYTTKIQSILRGIPVPTGVGEVTARPGAAPPRTPSGTPSAMPQASAAAPADDVGSEYDVAFGFNQPYTTPFNPAIPNHRGVDLVVRGAANNGRGAPVRAFRSGTVHAVTNDPNGGNGLIVANPDGTYDYYGHFDSIHALKPGQPIVRGQTIGSLGATGTEGFPHLHYEVRRRVNGDPMNELIDPMPYVRQGAAAAGGQPADLMMRAPIEPTDSPDHGGGAPRTPVAVEAPSYPDGTAVARQYPASPPMDLSPEPEAAPPPTADVGTPWGLAPVEPTVEPPAQAPVEYQEPAPAFDPYGAADQAASPYLTPEPDDGRYESGPTEVGRGIVRGEEDQGPSVAEQALDAAGRVGRFLFDPDRPRRIVEEAAASLGMRWEPRTRPPLQAPEGVVDPELPRLEALANARDRGFTNAGAGLVDAAADISRMLGAPSASRAFEEWADQILTSVPEEKRRRRTQDALDGPFGLAEALVESGPSLLPTVLGAILTGAGVMTGNPALATAGARTAQAGLALGGLSSFGAMARELRPEVAAGRMTQGTADAVAIGAGLVEVATEKIFPGIDKALASNMGVEAAKRTLDNLRKRGLAGAAKEIIKEAGQEGAEEAIAESYGVAVDAVFKEKKPTLAEAARRIAAAGVAGAAAGGALSTFTQGVQGAADRTARARIGEDVKEIGRQAGETAARELGRRAYMPGMAEGGLFSGSDQPSPKREYGITQVGNRYHVTDPDGDVVASFDSYAKASERQQFETKQAQLKPTDRGKYGGQASLSPEDLLGAGARANEQAQTSQPGMFDAPDAGPRDVETLVAKAIGARRRFETSSPSSMSEGDRQALRQEARAAEAEAVEALSELSDEELLARVRPSHRKLVAELLGEATRGEVEDYVSDELPPDWWNYDEGGGIGARDLAVMALGKRYTERVRAQRAKAPAQPSSTSWTPQPGEKVRAEVWSPQQGQMTTAEVEFRGVGANGKYSVKTPWGSVQSIDPKDVRQIERQPEAPAQQASDEPTIREPYRRDKDGNVLPHRDFIDGRLRGAGYMMPGNGTGPTADAYIHGWQAAFRGGPRATGSKDHYARARRLGYDDAQDAIRYEKDRKARAAAKEATKQSPEQQEQTKVYRAISAIAKALAEGREARVRDGNRLRPLPPGTKIEFRVSDDGRPQAVVQTRPNGPWKPLDDRTIEEWATGKLRRGVGAGAHTALGSPAGEVRDLETERRERSRKRALSKRGMADSRPNGGVLVPRPLGTNEAFDYYERATRTRVERDGQEVTPDTTPEPREADIVFVACGATKLDRRAKAKDLYTGELFKKARAYAEKYGKRWYILSAEHGLVDPEVELDPYDTSFEGMTPEQRRDWTAKVAEQLHEALKAAPRPAEGQSRTWTTTAGTNYRAPLELFAGAAGITLHVPMQGLGIGQQLAWLKQAAEGQATDDEWEPSPWVTDEDRQMVAESDAEMAQRPPHGGYLAEDEDEEADEAPAAAPPASAPQTPPADPNGPLIKAIEKLTGAVEQANQPAPTQPEGSQLVGPVGNEVEARGSDPSQRYRFRYRLVELDSLIPSHTDALAEHPSYPQELQPRDRGDARYRTELEQRAKKFDADELLTERKLTEHGPPTVGNDRLVESGNGRILLLRRIRAQHPDAWRAYRERLAARATEYGLTPGDVTGDRVLVRERVTELTMEERAAYARDANTRSSSGQNEAEQARADARLIDDAMLAGLQIGPDESVEEALNAKKNEPFVQKFVAGLPETEKTEVLDGTPPIVTRQGIDRMRAALFVRVYGEHGGRRLMQRFASTDEEVRKGISNLERALMGSLAQVAAVEGMTTSWGGDPTHERDPQLAIAADLVEAIRLAEEIRNDPNRDVEQFGRERPMFDTEYPAHIRAITLWVHRYWNAPAKVRRTLQEYARLVQAQPSPAQGVLFGAERATKLELFDAAARAANASPYPEEALGRPDARGAGRGDGSPAAPDAGPGDAAAPAPGGPGARTDSPGAGGRAAGRPEPAGGRGEADSGRPLAQVQTRRADKVPAHDESLIPPALRKHLSEHQRRGVALALAALRKIGGFLLADGTGVGKTRQQLALAKILADEGRGVLIVSPNQVLAPDANGNVTGSFAADAAAMGITLRLALPNEGDSVTLTPGTITITTYERLANQRTRTPRFALGQTDVVLLDEAHKIKNRDAAVGQAGREVVASARGVVYATATPTDRPREIAYLDAVLESEGQSSDAVMESLGLYQTDSGKWEVRSNLVGRLVDDAAHPGRKRRLHPSEEVNARIEELFERLTERGAMIAREIGMEGVEVTFDRTPLDARGKEILETIEREWLRLRGAGANSRMQIIMSQRRQQEPFKIARTVELVKADLAAGRRAVIFIAGVNETTARIKVQHKDRFGEVVSEEIVELAKTEGVAKLLREALAAEGITDVSEIHGGAEMTKSEGADRFQAGQSRVVIATIASGGTGINLDDRVGDAPRTAYIMTMPWSAVEAVQAMGRVWRLTTRSYPRIVAVMTDSASDAHNIAKIQEKLAILGATINGAVAESVLAAANDRQAAPHHQAPTSPVSPAPASQPSQPSQPIKVHGGEVRVGDPVVYRTTAGKMKPSVVMGVTRGRADISFAESGFEMTAVDPDRLAVSEDAFDQPIGGTSPAAPPPAQVVPPPASPENLDTQAPNDEEQAYRAALARVEAERARPPADRRRITPSVLQNDLGIGFGYPVLARVVERLKAEGILADDGTILDPPSAPTPATQRPPRGFKTAKGSVYELHPDGTTTRDKTARDEPGHEGDSGLKPRTAATYYVTADGARALAPPQGHRRMVENGDGTLSMATENADGRWGIAPSAANIRYETEPREGLQPVELWGPAPLNGRTSYGTVHFGNPIVELWDDRAGTFEPGDYDASVPTDAAPAAPSVAPGGPTTAPPPQTPTAPPPSPRRRLRRREGGITPGGPVPPGPPLPGMPPTDPPPEPTRHVVGFGYFTGIDDAEQLARLVELADDLAEYSRSGGVRRTEILDIALSAVDNDPAALQALVEDALKENTTKRAADGTSLRVAALRAFHAAERLTAEVDRLKAATDPTETQKLPAAIAALEAARATALVVMRASRRRIEAAARELNAAQSIFSVRAAARAVNQLDATSQRIADLVRRLADANPDNPSRRDRENLAELIRLLSENPGIIDGSDPRIRLAVEQVESLEGDEDGVPPDRAKRVNEGAEEAAKAAKRAAKELGDDAPTSRRQPSKPGVDVALLAEQLVAAHQAAVRLAAQQKLAELARVNARRAALANDLIDVLTDQVLAEQPQAIDDVDAEVRRRAARGVVALIRRQLRGPNPDVEQITRDARLLRDQVAAQLRADGLLAPVPPTITDLAERLVRLNRQITGLKRGEFGDQRAFLEAIADAEMARAALLEQLKARIEAKVREKMSRPNKPATQRDVDRALARGVVGRLSRQIDEQMRFPTLFTGKLGDALERRLGREITRERINAAIGRLKKIADVQRKTWRAGALPGNDEAIATVLAEVATLGHAPLERARLIRRSLQKQNLLRYVGRAVSDERFDELATEIMKLRTDDPRAVAAFLRTLRTPGGLARLREYMVINMLTGPMTWGPSGINVVSNIARTAFMVLVQTPGERIYDSWFQGGRNTAPGERAALIRGMRADLREAARRAGEMWATGQVQADVNQAMNTRDVGSVRVEWLSQLPGPIGLFFQVMHMLSTRPLQSADILIGHAVFMGKIAQLARRHAAKEIRERGGLFVPAPTQEHPNRTRKITDLDAAQDWIVENIWDFPGIIETAGKIEDALLYRTDVPETGVMGFAGKLVKARAARSDANLFEQAASFGMFMIWPFMRVGYNVLADSLAVTPPGMLYQMAMMPKTPADQRGERAVKIAFGLGLMLLAAALSEADLLTGGGPPDGEERTIWLRTHRPWSLRLGDTWVSLDGLWIALPLLMTAEAIQAAKRAAAKKGKGGLAVATDVEALAAGFGGGLVGAANTVLGQSFMRSWQELYDMLRGRRDPSSLGASQVSRLIPASGMIRFLARSGDEYERAPEAFWSHVAATVPGWTQQLGVPREWTRESVPFKLDEFGRPIRNAQPGFRALIPLRPGTLPFQQDRTVDELSRRGVTFPRPPAAINGTKLTPEQRIRFQMTAGPRALAELRTEIAGPSYAFLSPEEKAKALDAVIRRVRQDVGATIVPPK